MYSAEMCCKGYGSFVPLSSHEYSYEAVNTYIVMLIVHMFCTCYDWVYYNGIVVDSTSMEPDLQRSTWAVVYPIKTAEG